MVKSTASFPPSAHMNAPNITTYEEHWATAVLSGLGQSKHQPMPQNKFDLLLPHAKTLPQLQYAHTKGANLQGVYAADALKQMCHRKNTPKEMLAYLLQHGGRVLVDVFIKQHNAMPLSTAVYTPEHHTMLARCGIDWSLVSQSAEKNIPHTTTNPPRHSLEHLASYHHWGVLLKVLAHPPAFAARRSEVLNNMFQYALKDISECVPENDPGHMRRLCDVLNKILSKMDDVANHVPMLRAHTKLNTWASVVVSEKGKTTVLWKGEVSPSETPTPLPTEKELKKLIKKERKSVKDVELLVRCGVDLNKTTLFHPRTFLETAVVLNNTAVVKALLKHGADWRTPSKVFLGKPLLHTACTYGGAKPELVALLIAQGADPHERAANGETTLHAAAAAEHTHIINLLGTHKVDPNAVDDKGNTALFALPVLHTAGFIAPVEALVALGVDVFHRNHAGQSFVEHLKSNIRPWLGTEDVLGKVLDDYVATLSAHEMQQHMQNSVSAHKSTPRKM